MFGFLGKLIIFFGFGGLRELLLSFILGKSFILIELVLF